MSALRHQKIILGVTGSIAAYKCGELVRLLVKAGAEVQVIMTEAATEFISPLTLSTLSKRPVITEMWEDDEWNQHVEMGLWADHMLIAPATAHTLAKMATGLADNFLLATYLSAKCPVSFAPAMDLDMWKHPSTIANIKTLRSYGHTMIDVGDGELASGLRGKGRLAELDDILQHLVDVMTPDQSLKGKRALVTAGPTREHLDPVRYLSNPSTGRMGIAVADALASRGAEVTLVLGPSLLSAEHPGVTTVEIQSAAEMYEACASRHEASDICVFAAAVADYRPAMSSDQKIKKADDDMSIALERTTDIAATLGRSKGSKIHVGFALETQHGEANAKAKLSRKNFDFIVLNSPTGTDEGFGSTTNRVTIYGADNTSTKIELKDKRLIAEDIAALIVTKFTP